MAAKQHCRLLSLPPISVWLVLAASQFFGMPGQSAPASYDQLPRKVLIGTVVGGYSIYTKPLEQRLERIDEIMGEIGKRANAQFPGKRLDLVVFTEYIVARPGELLSQKVVGLREVEPTLAACSRKYSCYVVVPFSSGRRDAPTDLATPRFSLIERDTWREYTGRFTLSPGTEARSWRAA